MANGRNGNGNGNGRPVTPITRDDLDSVEALSRRFGLFAEEMRTGMDLVRGGMKSLTEFVKMAVEDMERRQDAVERRQLAIERKLAVGGKK